MSPNEANPNILFKMSTEFQTSRNEHPPIPPGAADPYTPPEQPIPTA